MKGITPIISVIILLLITVGLASAAWTYMSNYFTSLTAKVVEIPTQKCPNGQNVMAILHNIGTQSINIRNDILVMLGSTALSDTQLDWCELNQTTCTTTEKTLINSGGYAKVTINTACCSTDCPRTCSYDMIVSGRAQSISVYCPGA
jgi:flagellin-like protein